MIKRFKGTGIEDIAEKVFKQERISVSDGVRLFEAGDLHALGMLAHHVRCRKNGGPGGTRQWRFQGDAGR